MIDMRNIRIEDKTDIILVPSIACTYMLQCLSYYKDKIVATKSGTTIGDKESKKLIFETDTYRPYIEQAKKDFASLAQDVNLSFSPSSLTMIESYINHEDMVSLCYKCYLGSKSMDSDLKVELDAYTNSLASHNFDQGWYQIDTNRYVIFPEYVDDNNETE